jgi:hypothetical protein
MPRKINGTVMLNGQKTLGECPQCKVSNIFPNIAGTYSVPDMYPNETARCLSDCGYVEFETGKGDREDPVHGGCRTGCQQTHRVSLPVLRDRADGVRGHFAIGQWIDGFYMHYWSVRNRRWASCSDYVSLTEARAQEVCEKIRLTYTVAKEPSHG